MNILQSKLDTKISKDENETPNIPTFNTDGSYNKNKKGLSKKWKNTIAILLILGTVLYVPGLFMGEKEKNEFVIKPNIDGINLTTQATKMFPDEDFDHDGIKNSMEIKYNTSIRRWDTDRDGTGDYAELFNTNTDPLAPDDSLYKRAVDELNGEDAKKPFKTHCVVLWADDVESRVFGGVIRTPDGGFHFCNFSGWAQFPDGKYAYKVENGKHKLLEHKEKENAWRIDGDCVVLTSDEPLEMVYEIKLLGLDAKYLTNNKVGKVLEFILPEKGILSCRKIAKIDTWVNSQDLTTAPIVKIDYDKKDLERFKEHQNSLEALMGVYTQISKGNSVLVSLNSAEYGEVIAEVYGFTNTGDLMIANAKTLKPIGIISIDVRTGKYIDQSNSLISRDWYEFKGLGFDSLNNDRINFFAAAIKEEPTTVAPTEAPTEAPSEEAVEEGSETITETEVPPTEPIE